MCKKISRLLEECEEIDALSEPRRKLVTFLKSVLESGGTEPAETPPAPSSTRPRRRECGQ